MTPALIPANPQLSISAPLNNTNELRKEGPGTLNLSGSNTAQTGAVAIDQGALLAASNNVAGESRGQRRADGDPHECHRWHFHALL